jgi:hypothetical protein
MKKLMTVLAGILLCIGSFAQTVSIIFRGNTPKNYQVFIDGNRYYSGSSSGMVYNTSYSTSNAANQRVMRISNLQAGTHKIDIYNASSSTGTGQLLYTNNFQLRTGYDMNITMNGNRINFSEKINPSVNANGQYRTAMTSANFQQVLNKVKQNRYQDSRIAAIRTALSSADYFTTDQISQLLMLVNAESARLDLAKTAYAVVSDPSNYGELSTLFDSQSNINSLNAYISTQATVTGITGGSTVTSRTLLSEYDYDRLLQSVRASNYTAGKYSVLSTAFSNASYAFTTAQVRQLLGEISSESDRLYLVKQAYPTVTDPAAFSGLLNMFSIQSNREVLNTFIIDNGGIGNNALVITKTPMSDEAFNTLIKKSSGHIRQTSVYSDLKTAFNNPQNNFSTEQVKRLLTLAGSSNGGLFPISESNRVELAKLAYNRVTDPVNYSSVVSMYSSQASRDEINAYINAQYK